MDTFTRLGNSLLQNSGDTGANFVNRVFVVDLFAVLDMANMAAILRDRLQFDLFYYGGILKFWPQLTPDALNVALTDASQMEEKYPLLAPK